MVRILKHQYHQKLFMLIGIALLAGIFFYELGSGHGLISVAYLLVLPFILFLFDKKRYAIFIGLLTSIFLIIGFLLSDNINKGIFADNRVLSAIAVWMMVCFSVWYRRALYVERKIKKHLNAIFENATEGIIIVNSTGNIEMINPIALELFGYRKEELIEKKIELLIPDRFTHRHEIDRKNYIDFPRNRPMGNATELYAKRKDQSEFPAEISLGHFTNDEKLYIIAFITDITERKQNLAEIHQLNDDLEKRVLDRTKKLSEAYHIMENTNIKLEDEIKARESIEKKLITTQNLYKAMAQHFPNGIIGILNKDLKYVLVDGTGLKEMDEEEAKLLQDKIFKELEFLEISSKGKIRKNLAGNTISFEVAIKENYYKIKAVPLPENNNLVDKILIVIDNITKAKRNELTLIKNLEQEKELGKLKTRFVSTASHEFRTPLSTIMTSAYLLNNYKGEDFNKIKDTHITRINKSVTNLTDILNDFLSLSKLEEGKIETSATLTEVPSYMIDIIKEMELQKQELQKIEYEHSGSTTIKTDTKILRNIVLNVLSNAIKYSKADGLIKLYSLVDSEKLIIKVIDFGIGIPDKEQPLIFKRFFRAENASYIQGTGLGLNIVKKYVKLLDGNIYYKSKLNEGSAFTIELPIEPVIEENTILEPK